MPKTQGEIESAICDGISRFQLEFMGRGPRAIRTHVMDDVVFIRLQGVLTAAEQHLVKALPPDKGRDLLKQVRSQLVEIARTALDTMISDITGIPVVSLHHDISTVSGEEIIVFTLSAAPIFRTSSRGK